VLDSYPLSTIKKAFGILWQSFKNSFLIKSGSQPSANLRHEKKIMLSSFIPILFFLAMISFFSIVPKILLSTMGGRKTNFSF